MEPDEEGAPENLKAEPEQLTEEQRVHIAGQELHALLRRYNVTLEPVLVQTRNVAGHPPQILLDLGFRVVAQ